MTFFLRYVTVVKLEVGGSLNFVCDTRGNFIWFFGCIYCYKSFTVSSTRLIQKKNSVAFLTKFLNYNFVVHKQQCILISWLLNDGVDNFVSKKTKITKSLLIILL